MKKILTLVLSSDIPLYQDLDAAIRSTWGSGNDDVRYYYPNRPALGIVLPFGEVREFEDVIVTGYEQTFYAILAETLAVYEHVGSWPYDYVFRCCSGSYIVHSEMMKYIDDKPTEKFYAGAIGSFGDLRYASGSGYFLSMDLVRLLGSAKKEIMDGPDPGCNDDIAVGRYMRNAGIDLTSVPRVEPCDTLSVHKNQFHYHVGASPDNMRLVHENITRLTVCE